MKQKQELTVDNVIIREGATVTDEETSKQFETADEMTVRNCFKKYDATKLVIELTVSKNLRIKFEDSKSWVVRKREYEFKKEVDEFEEVEEDDDEFDAPENIDTSGLGTPTKDLTPKQQRREERRAKRRRKKEVRKQLKQMKKNKEVDTPEFRKLEDEMLQLEGFEKPVQDEPEGDDMYQLAETKLGEDFEKYPKNLKILVLRGQKLKSKMDRVEMQFGKRFCRMFRQDLRKRYGKKFREENYGDVLKTLLEL